MFFLDISRTIARDVMSMPTGIDRIELEYINFFLENPNSKFIFQHGSNFYLAGADCVSTYIKNKKNKIDFDITSMATNLNGRIDGCYINVSHHGISLNNPIYTLPGVRKYIFLLSDLIPIQNPEYVRDGDAKTHEARLRLMASFGSAVICISDYTRMSYINWAEKNNIKLPPLLVSPLGINIFPSKTEDFEIPKSRKFFLYVSTLEPRKNHITLLHVWRRLMDQMEELPLLVFVGKRGWNNEDLFRYLDQNCEIKKYIREMGSVSDQTLDSLMRDAHAILFPSLNEGWGLPISEAASYGKKIICSDIPPLREASQGNATFIDPLNVSDWVREVRKIYQSSNKVLPRTTGWTWGDHFKIVKPILECYDEHAVE